MKKQWFDVDKEGLRKLVADRAPSFVLWELVANAWDEPGVKEVYVHLIREPNSPFVSITVEDDAPEGFYDLSHAWTLFADVRKRKDPGVRGRFCLGDKLVLAMAKTAEIVTTTGGVRFDEDGRHKLSSLKEHGSSVKVEVRMSTAEVDQAKNMLCQMAIPPQGIRTFVDMVELKSRKQFLTFEENLPTVKADGDGVMRKVVRLTDIELHQANDPEGGWLFEMGIPVVRTGDKWDYNVMQKIPLNQERDNVSSKYLRQLRVHVLNHAVTKLWTKEEANEQWVRDACSHPDADPQAVKQVMVLRFGKDAVIYDPSDRESNLKAASLGKTVVAGASLSTGEWENVRNGKIMLPAGQVCPTQKMYAPEGVSAEVIDKAHWTIGENVMALLTVRIAAYSGLKTPVVKYVKAGHGFGKPSACNVNDGEEIHYNVDVLGRGWAVKYRLLQVLNLIIHELAHHKGEGHFDQAYINELSRIGANATALALQSPEMFSLPD